MCPRYEGKPREVVDRAGGAVLPLLPVLLGVQFALQQAHGLEEGLLLCFVELVQDVGDGTGRAVEPLGDQRGVGRSDLGDGSSPVSRVGKPLNVADPIEVGEDAADGGQAQTETLGQFADRVRCQVRLARGSACADGAGPVATKIEEVSDGLSEKPAGVIDVVGRRSASPGDIAVGADEDRARFPDLSGTVPGEIEILRV